MERDDKRARVKEGERGTIADSPLVENENGTGDRHCRCWIEEDEVKWFNDDN